MDISGNACHRLGLSQLYESDFYQKLNKMEHFQQAATDKPFW